MQKYTGNVVIATFFYKHQTLLDYTHSLAASLLVLDRLGIKHDYWPTSGNFHMEVVINSVLTKFLETDDVTDIIIVDSDESWNPAHLVRLLMHKEDVVCGVYLQTNIKARKYPVLLRTAEDGSHLGKMLPDGNCLLEAEKIPGGFMKVSKRALKKWTETYPDKWITHDGKKSWAFFMNEIRGEDHEFHGMDFVFSESLRKCGFQIWVDPICDVTHYGLVPFKGTLDAYLRAEKKRQDSGDAFSTIAQMAKEIEARNG